MSRIAVVGSGIAGLAVARRLSGRADVTLFEAADYFGGHAHTVDLTLDGITHGVDTGFLVLNERTYPLLLRLFAELQIELATSEMSFSVQVPADRLEWSGAHVAGLFAQRRNALRPTFWLMLADVLRFNRLATVAAQAMDHRADHQAGAAHDQTIGDFLLENRFSDAFRDWYFLPMIGCIWSCSSHQMLRFPVATLIRFCHNHGLLQIAGRPPWFTVRGGSRGYVEKITAGLADARLRTPVRNVRRVASTELTAGHVVIGTDRGAERFDDVVLACHSDQALALLADPSADERAVLAAIRYQRNRAVLHTDTALLPRRRAAWAAWNYESSAARSSAALGGGARYANSASGAADRAAGPSALRTAGTLDQTHANDARVCLHYLINRLQPLPFATPVVVSLNPIREPRPDLIHGEYDYDHPVFDAAAIAAQQRLPTLQGVGRTWFCGAWTRYGFHEDGLLSAHAVCDGLEARERLSGSWHAEPEPVAIAA